MNEWTLADELAPDNPVARSPSKPLSQDFTALLQPLHPLFAEFTAEWSAKFSAGSVDPREFSGRGKRSREDSIAAVTKVRTRQRHSSRSGNPWVARLSRWIPACAGMTGKCPMDHGCGYIAVFTLVKYGQGA